MPCHAMYIVDMVHFAGPDSAVQGEKRINQNEFNNYENHFFSRILIDQKYLHVHAIHVRYCCCSVRIACNRSNQAVSVEVTSILFRINADSSLWIYEYVVIENICMIVCTIGQPRFSGAGVNFERIVGLEIPRERHEHNLDRI